ncbi:MAG: hypothetical protein QOI15_3168 [Pseudonocardiales bacterium]|jgi:hypothetical protein|nr:hypothetical protein [Pseudonocardiales bacterium]
MTTLRAPSAPIGIPVAAIAGLLAGALTCLLQGVVPADWNTAVNSGAVWTVVAFGAAALLAQTQSAAVIAGLLVLVGEVAGYYLYLADVRHLPGLRSEELLWTVAALWIGPLTGLAAYRARWGDTAARMTALAAIAGVVAGEGVYLVRIAGMIKSGWLEIGVGAAVAAAAMALRPAPAHIRAGAVLSGIVVAVAVYAAYRLLAFN